jgi:uncharacterized protein (TIGR02284 family)
VNPRTTSPWPASCTTGSSTALTGGPNDKGVINEVERGEDVIKAKYEAATKDDELPTELRTKIIDAYQSVKSDHDEISRIKHSMH